MDIQERHMKTSYECLSFAQIISYAYQDKEYFQRIIRNAQRAVDLVAFMKFFIFFGCNYESVTIMCENGNCPKHEDRNL